MREIFISYRRSDTEESVGRISEALKRKFGEDAVFKDVDSIPAGSDFREAIDKALLDAKVVLVAIGVNWNTPRLREEDDYVRMEIQAALASGKRVIPLLVGGAKMPERADLPPEVGELVFRNALPVRPDPDFPRDVDRLIDALQKTVSALDRHSQELARNSDNAYKVSHWEKIVASAAALFIIGLISFLVVRDKPFSDPNFAVFVRVLLSLACAVLGAVVPGFLHVSVNGKGLAIRAGGALALFIITYFFSPKVANAQADERTEHHASQIQARIEMLEATVKLLASQSDLPTTSPSAAEEFREVKESLETIIENARNDPQTLSIAPLDVAVIVAHGPTIGGATGNANGQRHSEFSYNAELAPLIVQYLAENGLAGEVFFRREDRDVRSAVVAAAARTPSLIIELHANAGNGVVRGSEALVRPNDPAAVVIAESILDSIQSSVGIPKRFVRTIAAGSRGSTSLYATTRKALLLETFFIDNKMDLEVALTKQRELAEAIAVAIAKKIKE